MYCRDLEGMRCFFEKYLGGVSGPAYHNPRTNLRTYFMTFSDGGARLEIMTRPEVEREGGDHVCAGLSHVSFALGSKAAVDELTVALSADGFETLSDPRTTGDGYYESCVRGPEGVLLELTV